MHQTRVSFFLASAALVLFTPSARAEAPTSSADRPAAHPAARAEIRTDRVLRGHTFLRPALLSNPFTMSSAAMSLSYATATFAAPGLDANIETLGFSPAFGFQIELGRLAIEGRLLASLAAGTDGYSALTFGASTETGYALGFKYLLVRTQTYLISAGLTASRRSGSSLLPSIAVESNITTRAQALASNLLTRESSTDWNLRMTGAFGFSPFLGGIVEVGRIFAPSREATEQGQYVFGAGLSANFQALNPKLPLGATLSLRSDLPTETTAKPSHTASFGLYEMFSEKFNLGVEYARLLQNTPSQEFVLSMTFFY